MSNEARSQVDYLTLADVVLIHHDLMAAVGLRSILHQRGALEAAAHRPMNVAHYEQADLFVQAAHLMGGIALTHAFEDGNKPLALVCTLTFLRANGVRITAPIGAIGDQVLAIVNRGARTLDEASAACGAWLEAHAEPI